MACSSPSFVHTKSIFLVQEEDTTGSRRWMEGLWLFSAEKGREAKLPKPPSGSPCAPSSAHLISFFRVFPDDLPSDALTRNFRVTQSRKMDGQSTASAIHTYDGSSFLSRRWTSYATTAPANQNSQPSLEGIRREGWVIHGRRAFLARPMGQMTEYLGGRGAGGDELLALNQAQEGRPPLLPWACCAGLGGGVDLEALI